LSDGAPCQVDQPKPAGFVQDLKERGLLDNTLVIWAGESGRPCIHSHRTSGRQMITGRDHHPRVYDLDATVLRCPGSITHD
jgi:hypothetical protein